MVRAKVTQATQEPSSLLSELSNPATYLTLASYIPMIWTFFNWPTSGESTIVTALKIASVLVGPIATAAYAFAHSVKVKAGQSRWAAVETAIVQEAKNFSSDPEVAIQWVTRLISAVHGVVNTPATAQVVYVHVPAPVPAPVVHEVAPLPVPPPGVNEAVPDVPR